MVLLVRQSKDGLAHGFHTHPTSGLKQKIGKESPGVNSSIVRKALHSLYNAVWALNQQTILWLIYKYNLGSCQYNFNLYDISIVKVIHYKTG